MKNTGIYVHIPFCKSKCGYCDFNSYTGMENSFDPYFSALTREIRLAGEKCPINADTVYIGGGTPTCVDTDYICSVMETIFSSYNIMKDCEITAECNPGTADKSALFRLRRCGINRLSIGLQSTDDSQLKALGRIHTFADFVDCFENARHAGFENLSLDLMYGLPNQTLGSWLETLKTAATLGAEHISCYSLKIEEGTPFAASRPKLPDDDTVADMYEACVRTLASFGYRRYEISNFAKDGFESKHNLKYWRCDDFLGLGAGAFSCMNNTRFSNCADVLDYIAKINSGGSAISDTIPLTAQDNMSEFVFLGLRCADGISVAEFKSRFGFSILDVYGKAIKKYTDMGFLILGSGRLRFADKGFFVSNTILSEFV